MLTIFFTWFLIACVIGYVLGAVFRGVNSTPLPRWYSRHELEEHRRRMTHGGEYAEPAAIIADLKRYEAEQEAKAHWKALDEVLAPTSHATALEELVDRFPEIAADFIKVKKQPVIKPVEHRGPPPKPPRVEVYQFGQEKSVRVIGHKDDQDPLTTPSGAPNVGHGTACACQQCWHRRRNIHLTEELRDLHKA